VDTVGFSDEEQDTRRDGDVLYGLGTADMKGACAAAVEAVLAIVASKVPLVRGVCVALVVGEEEYGDGAQTLAQNVHAPLTVVGEPTALAPCLDHYGYYECRLSAKGTQAHAALPEFGANAIHDMLAWLMDVLEVAGGPGSPSGIVVNPREIAGGAGGFVVADNCEAILDLHAPPSVSREALEALIDEARRRAQAKTNAADLQFEEMFWGPGFSVDPQSPALKPVRAAFTARNLPWSPGVFRSHSDASQLHHPGETTVICGPGRLEVAHTRDEHIHLAQLREAAQLYGALFFSACCSADRDA